MGLCQVAHLLLLANITQYRYHNLFQMPHYKTWLTKAKRIRQLCKGGKILHQISFSMPTPSKVTFSYIVSITQWGHPDWDAWTWNKFNAIGLRLVIDGLPFKESGTYADPNVKSTEDVIGDITMSLPAGPHIAKLQWKAVGTSVEEWRSLQSILDGFAGSRKLLAVLHPKNYAPLITTAPMQSVDEDKTVNIDIDVSDIDIATRQIRILRSLYNLKMVQLV